MTTTTTTTTAPRHRLDARRPFAAALAGAAAYAAAMAAGDVFDLNADSGSSSTGWGDIALYAGLVLVAVVAATWLGTRAGTGSPDRLARYALGLALASAATFVGFWSGWPQVLGAMAVVTALEHRRRIGGFSGLAATAMVIGLMALVASLVLCVIG